MESLALNELLNAFLRTRHNRYNYYYDRVMNIPFLTELLDRGASLYFRDPDSKMSSVVALVAFNDYHVDYFPISAFDRYLCCPLDYHSAKLTHFDPHRLAPLSCLAARRIPPSEIGVKLPIRLRSFIESHQELHAYLNKARGNPHLKRKCSH